MYFLKKTKINYRKRAGFTLVEILVVCIILAIFLLGLSYFSFNFNTAFDQNQIKVELGREGSFALETLKSLRKKIDGQVIPMGILEAKGVFIEDNGKRLVTVFSQPDPNNSTKEIYYLAYFYQPQEENSLKLQYKYNGVLSSPEIILPSTFVNHTLNVSFTYLSPEIDTKLLVSNLKDENLKNFLTQEGISELHNGVKIEIKLIESKSNYNFNFSSEVYCRNFGG